MPTINYPEFSGSRINDIVYISGTKSGLNSFIASKIPPYSVITNFTATLRHMQTLWGSSGDCSYVFTKTDEAAENNIVLTLNRQNDSVKYNQWNNHITNLTSYVHSGNSTPGQFNSQAGGTYTGWRLTSTLIREWSFYGSYSWTFEYPKLTINASTGGAIQQISTSTFEIQLDTEIPVKATAVPGYRFVKWSDEKTTNSSRTFTKSDLTSSHTTVTAIFEKIPYTLYDNLFNFHKWKTSTLTSNSLISISNITDTGFMGTALVDDAYTNNSPVISVEAGKRYKFSIDTDNVSNFEIFIFNTDANGAWTDFTYLSPAIEDWSFIPKNNYISIRCDVVGTGNSVNFNNIRIYPAECDWMENSLPANERLDVDTWSPPTPTRAEYVFKGWNTKPDGSGQYYNNLSGPIALLDLILYSQWAKYNIYFDGKKPKQMRINNYEIKKMYLNEDLIYSI